MGLRDRLFRLAELEFRSAARRLFGRPKDGPDDRFWSSRSSDNRAHAAPEPATAAATPEIQRYYANLELPVGASAEQVKAAYRRLMRRYHPDRHATDPERAQVATQVAQQLRTAYEHLLAHLGEHTSR